MSKRIAGAVMAVLCTLSLGACQTEPIYQPINHPIVSVGPARLSEARMSEIISGVVAASANWEVIGQEPGKVRARWHRHRTRTADVDIVYDASAYSIVLVSSYELYQENGEIHPSYNKAAHQLEKDIDLVLKNTRY